MRSAEIIRDSLWILEGDASNEVFALNHFKNSTGFKWFFPYRENLQVSKYNNFARAEFWKYALRYI